MQRSLDAFVRAARAVLALTLVAVASAPALAQDGDNHPLEFDGLIEIRGVASDLDIEQGEEIDSSGVGVRVRLGADYRLSNKTELRAEGEARIFDFRDKGRDSLETVIGRVSLTHQVSDQVEVRAHVRRYENIAVLEAFSADQTSIGGRVQWQSGNDRLRLEAEYREREFDTSTAGNSDGYRVAAQYNRRIGPYHWVRFDLRHEDMRSENESRRSFDRQVARATYSHPVSKRFRVRASIEYREWTYDARIAQGDPDGDLRRDRYVAPALEISAGRATRGLYGLASVEYRIRNSNDERYDNDAIRLGVSVGYRF